MTYVLTSSLGLPRATADAGTAPSLLKRLFALFATSRSRAAERELRARHLLLHETGMVLGGLTDATLSRDAALPFNR